MKQAILRIIQLWAIRTLYDRCYNTISRVNRKHKKIIFTWSGATLFKHFSDPKEQFAITLLTSLCGYKVYEERLCLWIPQKVRPEHTWGEIQDIIRAGKSARWPMPKIEPIPFNSESDNVYSGQ